MSSHQNENLNGHERCRQRRRFAIVDIKLLRLGLVAKENGPCQGISTDWIAAQPSENLSPFLAAEHLEIEPWSKHSVARKRYRTLQLRYPPEQFSNQHLNWRPAADLLSSPLSRLGWYWQSGLVPGLELAGSEVSADKVSELNRFILGDLLRLSDQIEQLLS